MVGTKSRGYTNSGLLSEGEYSKPFFCTRHSPINYTIQYPQDLVPGMSVDSVDSM